MGSELSCTDRFFFALEGLAIVVMLGMAMNTTSCPQLKLLEAHFTNNVKFSHMKCKGEWEP
jgi:hypothetical protein